MGKLQKRITQIFAGVVMLFAPSVMAATLPETEPFGPTTPNFEQTLTFNQFDTSLGTLTAINIEMILSISGGTLGLDNESESGGIATYELGSDGNLTSSDVNFTTSDFSPFLDGGLNVITSTTKWLDVDSGDPDDQYDTDGGTDNWLYTGGTNSLSDHNDMSSGTWTSGAKGYIGNGTFDIVADIDTYIDFYGISGLSYTGSPVTASGTVTVTYTYTTPVPEPATMVLFGIGLLGVAGISRKKLMKK